MKTVHENVRIEVQVRDPWILRKDPAKFFAQHKADAEEVVKQIKRHCDDVFGVQVVWDTRNVCEHCGYGWDDPKDKFNDCCEASAHPEAEIPEDAARALDHSAAREPKLPSCEDPECGCQQPAFTDPMEALRFLSGRFKYAGVSEGVALAYARDIDKILAAQPASGEVVCNCGAASVGDDDQTRHSADCTTYTTPPAGAVGEANGWRVSASNGIANVFAPDGSDAEVVQLNDPILYRFLYQLTARTGGGAEAVAWVVFDPKHGRYAVFNRKLAESIAERGLLTLPVFGQYEWFDAKAAAWKPTSRLPHTWEQELGIEWRVATPVAGDGGRDAARLDYIERTFSGMTNRERYLPVQMIWGKGCNGRTLREACDKYMARDALTTGQGDAGGEK